MTLQLPADGVLYALPATYALLLIAALAALMRKPSRTHVMPIAIGRGTPALPAIRAAALLPAAAGAVLILLLQMRLAQDLIPWSPAGLHCQYAGAAWQWLECTPAEYAAHPAQWLAPAAIAGSAAAAVLLRAIASRAAVYPFALLLCALTAFAGLTDLIAASIEPRGALPTSILLSSFQTVQLSCAAAFGLALCLVRGGLVPLARLLIVSLAVVVFQLCGCVSLLLAWPHVTPALACVMLGVLLMLPSVAACGLVLASARSARGVTALVRPPA